MYVQYILQIYKVRGRALGESISVRECDISLISSSKPISPWYNVEASVKSREMNSVRGSLPCIADTSVGLRRRRALACARQAVLLVVFCSGEAGGRCVLGDDGVRRVWPAEGGHDEARGHTQDPLLAALRRVDGHAACV